MTLVPDQTAMQQNLAALNTSYSGLVGNAKVLAGVDPNSISWGIVEAEFPDIFTAMQAEKANAAAFVSLDVMTDVVAAVSAFAATFDTQSQAMLTILTAVGDATPTPDQAKALASAMTALVSGLTDQVQRIEAKSGDAAKLSATIADPNGGFATGEASVQTAIAKTQANLNDLESMSQVPNSDPQAVAGGIMADQGIINWLQNLLSVLQGMQQTNQDMGAALGQTLVVWQTLLGKYQFVESQIGQAGKSASVLAVGDVRSAQLGWTQIEAYARGLTQPSG